MDMIYVVGPGEHLVPIDNWALTDKGTGHGAPAILASLWIEGSLGHFYPECGRDRAGLQKLITGFSTPGGFPRYGSGDTGGNFWAII